MREIKSHEDAQGSDYWSPDEVHSKADDLLCELLRQLGFGEGIDVYESIGRYFA